MGLGKCVHIGDLVALPHFKDFRTGDKSFVGCKVNLEAVEKSRLPFFSEKVALRAYQSENNAAGFIIRYNEARCLSTYHDCQLI